MHTYSTFLAAMAISTAACTAIGSSDDTLTQEGAAGGNTCMAADTVRGVDCTPNPDGSDLYTCGSRDDQFCGFEGDDVNELFICHDPDGDGAGIWASAGCGCACGEANDAAAEECTAVCPAGRKFGSSEAYTGTCGEDIEGLGAQDACIIWSCTEDGWVSDGTPCPGQEESCQCSDGRDYLNQVVDLTCGQSVCGLSSSDSSPVIWNCSGTSGWTETTDSCGPTDESDPCAGRGGDSDGDGNCNDLDPCDFDPADGCVTVTDPGEGEGGGAACTDDDWQCSGNASQKCIGGEWSTYHGSARGCVNPATYGTCSGSVWSCSCSALGYDTEYGC